MKSVLKNGICYTLDAAGTVAEAVLMEDGRIKAVGSNAEILAAAGEDANVIDAQGHAVDTPDNVQNSQADYL